MRVGSGWSPDTKITRRPPFLTGPSLKRAVTIELNALTMRAPCARAATISLAPLPPRSARTSRGLTTAELGDFVHECIRTTSAAQDHFMAPGQRLSTECERDSAGADRAKF